MRCKAKVGVDFEMKSWKTFSNTWLVCVVIRMHHKHQHGIVGIGDTKTECGATKASYLKNCALFSLLHALLCDSHYIGNMGGIREQEGIWGAVYFAYHQQKGLFEKWCVFQRKKSPLFFGHFPAFPPKLHYNDRIQQGDSITGNTRTWNPGSN